MKRKIFSKLLMGALLVASVSSFTSCKDYDDDINANKQAIIDVESKLQTEVASLKKALEDAKADFNTKLADYATKVELANGLATKADKATLEALAKIVDQKADQSSLDALSQIVATKADKAELDAYATNKALDDAINALKETLKAYATVEQLNTAVQQAQATLQAAIDQKASIEDMEKLEKSLQTQINTINTSLADYAKITDVKDWIAAATKNLVDQETLNKALKAAVDPKADKTEVDKALNELRDQMKSFATKDDIKDFITAEALTPYAKDADLKTLANDFKTLSNNIAAISSPEMVKKLTNAVDKIAEVDAYLNDEIKAKIAGAQNADQVKAAIKLADEAVRKDLGEQINILTVGLSKMITSLNLRPSDFYGGIEGVSIWALEAYEQTNGCPSKYPADWHFFQMEKKTPIEIADYGYADFHISPVTADLTGAQIDFYSWEANINEPATTELTRSGLNKVWPVYNNYDELIAKNPKAFKDGVLTVPFKADAKAIADKLWGKNSIGTIAALQMSIPGKEGKPDTTVTSDYALIVPKIAHDLLICDNSFDDDDDAAVHQDVIGLWNGKVSSFHLHRNFSYLALSTTSATHEIVYDEKFDITKVLETHYVDIAGLVRDTANTHTLGHPATTDIDATKQDMDGSAAVAVEHCHKITPAQLERLGLTYDIHRVEYSLGTTNTSESAHIELVTDEDGHVWACPRNVSGKDGSTIYGETANASSVGRMPIVCIELKKDGKTVSFAWMKFLIVDKFVKPQSVKVDFNLGDYYADCAEAEDALKWYQVEYYIYNDLLNTSKEAFDKAYEYDYYAQEPTMVEWNGITMYKMQRFGNRFQEKKDGSFEAAKTIYGEVVEEWNESLQHAEDATTHILKWRFSTEDFWAIYNDLKKAGNLEDKGNELVNKVEIATWVRYKRKDAYADENGEPGIYVKLVIPVGKMHFAKGQLNGVKTLTYWYNRDSKVNAETADNAKEVRVNVPVPVPAEAQSWTYLNNGENCIDNFAPLSIFNDNLLTESEFIKDLHDFFKNGELGSSLLLKDKFPKMAKKNLIPEFRFTLPEKDVNADFSAVNGQWTVKGISGETYTLKLNDALNEILIVKVGNAGINPVVLCCLNDDKNLVQSVIRYHEGKYQDDILNYMSHNELGSRETFTAYIQINVDDACVPVVFDDMYFNVRFLRPLDLSDPKGDIVEDALNDWQYIDLAKYAQVIDWRDYVADPKDRVKGYDTTIDKIYKVDYIYYQVELATDDQLFKTDAGLGTAERDPNYTIETMWNVNDPEKADYFKKLWKTSEVQGLMVERVYDRVGISGDYTVIRYKNNSGITGGFHLYVPVTMQYVFGKYPTSTQLKYVTLGIKKSHNQDQE